MDATLINAPSSTKIASGKRDREMHQSEKGNRWYFVTHRVPSATFGRRLELQDQRFKEVASQIRTDG